MRATSARIALMTKRLIVACVAAALVHLPHQARAQFTDPRNYENAAVGTNQLELSYAHVNADASIDTSLTITGAHLSLDQGTFDYTRYFGVLHRVVWVEAAVPVARLGGAIDGTNIQGSTAGAGDSTYSVAMLLKGGPALSVEQFRDYRPATTLGLSLAVIAPTGAYDPNRILNLGADRWSFKPEIALAHPFGAEQKWQVDGYANVYFYTDNTTYHGKELLRQQTLSGLEGHLSYAITDSTWVALDTRYSFRGSTFVDGVSQDNPQRNFVAGSEVNVSLNSRSSLVFEVAKAFVHVNGPSLVGLSVKYDYTWGKGHE
jgi:hypothetical protein